MKRMKNYINNGLIRLHEESLFLDGARDVLLQMERTGGIPQWEKGRNANMYNNAILREIMNNRESLRRFLLGEGWRYAEHEFDKRGKVINVKVIFDNP